MKKLLAALLVVMMLITMTACGAKEGGDDLKVGFIFLHDEQSTYDKNFIDAAIAACDKMGVEMVQKTQIPESNKCYDAAVSRCRVLPCNRYSGAYR